MVGFKKETLSGSDYRWLGSKHGTDAARSVTLSKDLFDGTAFEGGTVPSGVVLAKATSGDHEGKFGPYDDSATDGRDTAVGFLLTPRSIADFDQAAALLTRGRVVEDHLPDNHGLDADGKSDLALVEFV